MAESKKISWDELVKKAPYLEVENTQEKTPSEVAGELAEMLIGFGYECLDDSENENDWLEKHPELDAENCEWCCISTLEFLCSNGPYERCGHDVDWYEFHISFFGIWGKVGVFQVEIN